jgi:hypothetical protein
MGFAQAGGSPLDVVGYGGVQKDNYQNALNTWAPVIDINPSEPIWVRVHSICAPSLIGAPATQYWAISGDPTKPPVEAVITPLQPFALLGGMLFGPHIDASSGGLSVPLYVFNGAAAGSVLTVVFDLVLAPNIQ